MDGRWRVHINGEGGMMVSVMFRMFTSEASDAHERWSRAKRVMVMVSVAPSLTTQSP